MKFLAIIDSLENPDYARLVEVVKPADVPFDKWCSFPEASELARQYLDRDESVMSVTNAPDDLPGLLQTAFYLGRDFEKLKQAANEIHREEGPGRWLAIAPGREGKETKYVVFDLPADWKKEALDYAFTFSKFAEHEPTVAVRIDRPAEELYQLFLNMGRDMAIQALRG